MKKALVFSIVAASFLAFSLPEKDGVLRELFDRKMGMDEHILPDNPKDVDFQEVIPISNDTAAYYAGKYLFEKEVIIKKVVDGKTLITHSSCATCHQLSLSGNSSQRFPVNFGGEGEGILRKLIEGFPEPDKPKINSPSFLGIGAKPNALWDSSMGCGGVNVDLPDSIMAKHEYHDLCDWYELNGGMVQARKGGFDVHGLTIKGLLQDPLSRVLVKAATGVDYCDEWTVSQLLLYFEVITRPLNAPFQRWLKGDDEAMTARQKKGLDLFIANCGSCHNNQYFGSHKLFPKIVKSHYEGRGGFTGLEEDMGKVSVPGLYHLKHRKFKTHVSKYKGFKPVIKAHERTYGSFELSKDELKAIDDFVHNALYDETMMEYRFR